MTGMMIHIRDEIETHILALSGYITDPVDGERHGVEVVWDDEDHGFFAEEMKLKTSGSDEYLKIIYQELGKLL